MKVCGGFGSLILIFLACGCESSRGDRPGAPDTRVENQQEKILTELISQALALDDLRKMQADLPQKQRKVIYLIDSPWSMKWPATYRPSIPGIEWKKIDRSTQPDPKGRALGFRLEKLNLNDPNPDPFRGNVSLAFVPIRRDPIDPIALSLCYRVQLKGDQWTAELLSWLDP